MEEGDEEAGPERQQVGRRAVGGPKRQQPLAEGLEVGAGEAAAGPER